MRDNTVVKPYTLNDFFMSMVDDESFYQLSPKDRITLLQNCYGKGEKVAE